MFSCRWAEVAIGDVSNDQFTPGEKYVMNQWLSDDKLMNQLVHQITTNNKFRYKANPVIVLM